jgi:ABC-type antimicrobial peptide transport system permease subunit
MAFGAARGNVLAMVLRQGLVLALLGLGAGLAMDWAVIRLMSRLLYGVEPYDPVTIASVSALLLVFALVASLVPALRAASTDPILALRAE